MNRNGFPAAPRSTFWIAILSFCILAGLASPPVYGQYSKSAANRLIKEGHAAEQREDWDAAYSDYVQAAARNPKDLRAREAMFRVRSQASAMHMAKGRQLQQQGDEQSALTEFMRAAEIDPTNETATQQIALLREHLKQAATVPEISPEQAAAQQELDSIGSPVELKPVTNEPLTLHMVQDTKTIYEAIGHEAGINVLFDPDYSSKRIQVDLQNSTLMDALRIVGVMSNTFWRPITSNTIFVAQNSRSKRTELDEQAVQTFYLTNAWQQNDLNDVQTALRNVLTNIKVYGLASQNALVVRGTPDELLLAQKLISDLDKARPEVVVDVAVMEVSKNWERNLGLSWPSSASVGLQTANSSNSTTTCPTGSTTCTPGTTTGGTTTGTNPTLFDLSHLNASDFSVTVGAATANLLLSDSNTRILQNPRLRATDMQKASLKVGEKIPYATGSFSSGLGVGGGGVGGFPAAETQFQFIDVGVNLEITPTVHFDRDITLKLKIEVTAQAGSSTISGVTEPIIAQKTSEEVVRLREGEANILSGIMNQEDQVSWSGIPGLSSIPILKYLFGSKDHTITNDEVVFLMVPHIVRGQDITATNLRPIDTGPGQSVQLRRIAVEGPGVNDPAQIQPMTSHSIAPRIQPGIATVPGQNAAAAAPTALDQMRATVGAATPEVPQTNLNVKQPEKAPAGEPPTPPPPVNAQPQAAAPTTPSAAPVSGAAPGATPPPASGAAQAGPDASGKVKFLLSSPGPVKPGSTFQVPVVISGAADIDSVPLQMQYDPEKLSLVNVGPGDFLSRDGQSVALVHRDDGPGTLTLNASRPPGAPGVNGAGVVCMLTFQAKAAGSTMVVITKPGAMSSAQKPVPALGAQLSVDVK